MLSQEFRYYEGKEEKKLYLQKDYLADFTENSSFIKNIDPKGKLLKKQGTVSIYQVGDPKIRNQIQKGTLTKSLKPQSKLSEVFSTHPSGGPKIALPGNIIIKFKDSVSKSQIDQILQSKNLKVIRIQKILEQDYYIIESPSGLASLELANQLASLPEVEYSKPDLWIEISKR
ncbi:MAG: S8 family serine peptidase [Leptonema sp. (in: bacteria)]